MKGSKCKKKKKIVSCEIFEKLRSMSGISFTFKYNLKYYGFW